MKKGIIAAIVIALLAGCGFGGWKYYNNKKTEEMREAGVKELKASINLNDYRSEEQKTINEILSNTEAKIRESDEEGAVDALLKDASTEFSELKTDDQYKKEEEAERKRQEELERKRQEEEAARIAAEEEAARQAAAAAASKKSKKKSSSGGGNGCVGGGSDAFY